MIDRPDQRPTSAPAPTPEPPGAALRWALALLGAALVTILVSCLGSMLLWRSVQQRWAPHRYTWQQLDRLPEAQLYHPACEPMSRGGKNASTDIAGYHPTRLTFGCATTIDEQTLRAWYDRELTARGWRYVDYEAYDHYDGMHWFVWRKEGLSFRLTVRPDAPGQRQQTPGSVHGYWMEIVDDSYTREQIDTKRQRPP